MKKGTNLYSEVVGEWRTDKRHKITGKMEGYDERHAPPKCPGYDM